MEQLDGTFHLRLTKVIGATAASLAYYALEVAPEAALEAGGSVDRLMETLRLRLGRYPPRAVDTGTVSRSGAAGLPSRRVSFGWVRASVAVDGTGCYSTIAGPVGRHSRASSASFGR